MLLGCSSYLNAQMVHRSAIDSMQYLARTTDSDAVRWQTLADLAWELTITQPDQALRYAEQAEAIAIQLDDDYRLAVAMESQAGVLDRQGHTAEAAQKYLAALRIHEEQGNRQALTATTVNLGHLCADIGDTLRAAEYYQRTADLGLELNDAETTKLALMSLASIRSSSAPESALRLYQRATIIVSPVANASYNATIAVNVANLHRRQKDYEKADVHYARAIALGEEIGDIEAILFAHSNRALNYLRRDRPGEALPLARRAVSLADSLDYAIIRLNSRLYTAEALHLMGHKAEAADTMRAYMRLKEDLQRQQNLPAVYASQQLYDQEAQLIALTEARSTARQRQRLVIGLAIGLVLLGAGALLWVAIARRRAASRLTEAQARLQAMTYALEQKNRELLRLREAQQPDTGPATLPDPDEPPETLTETTILTAEDWKRYRAQFEVAVPGFFERLRAHLPNATEGEERLSALLRLGLDNGRIAGVLGISKEGARKGVYRLRLKLEQESAAALRAWIEGV